MAFEGIVFDISVATSTDRDDRGFPQVQEDSYGEGNSDYFELQHTYGFYSRPRDPKVTEEGQPKEGEGCTLLVGTDGDTRYGWLGIDPRYIESIPLVEPGGSGMYAVVEDEELDEEGNNKVRAPFFILDGDDGSATLYIPLKGDKAHVLQVGYDDDGNEAISFLHSSGVGWEMIDNAWSVHNRTGTSYITVDDDGVTIAGPTTIAGSLDQGAVGSEPLVTQSGLAAILAPLLTWLAAGAPPGPKDATPVGAAIATLLALPSSYTKTTRGL